MKFYNIEYGFDGDASKLKRFDSASAALAFVDKYSDLLCCKITEVSVGDVKELDFENGTILANADISEIDVDVLRERVCCANKVNNDTCGKRPFAIHQDCIDAWDEAIKKFNARSKSWACYPLWHNGYWYSSLWHNGHWCSSRYIPENGTVRC